MLVAGYTLYVIFMKFNVQIEHIFKTQLHKHKNIVKVTFVEEPEKVSTPVSEHECKIWLLISSIQYLCSMSDIVLLFNAINMEVGMLQYMM